MHGDLTLGGPLYWFVLGLFALCGGLAIFVAADVFRAKRAPMFSGPATRWLWFVPQVVYLALLLAQSLPLGLPAAFATTLVLATPVMLGVQVAYLLRVAYPSPARLAALELAATTLRNVPAGEEQGESQEHDDID